MRRTKYLLAVMVVTTALAADRSAMGAPAASKPQVVEIALKLATRLSSSFRQAVPAVRFHAESRHDAVASVAVPSIPQGVSVVHIAEVSPFFFRLPPPIV